FDDREGAEAVVFDFVQPVGMVEGLRNLDERHGPRERHDRSAYRTGGLWTEAPFPSEFHGQSASMSQKHLFLDSSDGSTTGKPASPCAATTRTWAKTIASRPPCSRRSRTCTPVPHSSSTVHQQNGPF